MKMKAVNPVKYASPTQPTLRFWAQDNREAMPGSVPSFCVEAQVDGLPVSEACDDWFANFEDADQMAQQLAVEARL